VPITALALAMGALVAAQDQTKPDQQKPTDDKKQEQAGLHFDIDGLIKEYDKNGDGFLQRDEVPAYLRDRFDQLDTNKDGKLSREELEKGMVHLQPRRRPSDVVFLLIETSDCDEECAGELQQIYDPLRRLDRNKDGKLDPEELKAARQQLLEE